MRFMGCVVTGIPRTTKGVAIMASLDVYVYGMTVLSTIHLLKGTFPAPDGYQEIGQTFVMPGGEAANSALVLRNLGLNVSLDACLLGDLTEAPLRAYFGARGIDCANMRCEAGFPGWRDMVFCDGMSRTVFGWFAQYLCGGRKLWTDPCEESIRKARCVALDPFFGDASETAAELCRRHGKDYVTIDWQWDRPLTRNAGAVVCSREFIDREYPGCDYRQLFREYQDACSGLVVFTFGSRPVLYGRRGEDIGEFKPFEVQVVDTLGAGDTFRAGIVYGVMQGWPDERTVRFASACAAVACTRFPSVHEPPGMDEALALMHG